jgi:hypothetical protein
MVSIPDIPGQATWKVRCVQTRTSRSKMCIQRTDTSLKSTNFCDMMPYSPLSVNRRFGGTYRLHLQGRKSKLSKKPAWRQVASLPVDTQRTIRRCIPEDGTLHNHRCDNLKSYGHLTHNTNTWWQTESLKRWILAPFSHDSQPKNSSLNTYRNVFYIRKK